MADPVYINAAESQSRHPLLVGREILHGFATSRYTAYRLALKDIKGAYAKTSLGLLWDIADPLMFGAIFYFLVAAGILHPGDMAIPYALFVTYGMLLYLTFTEALLSALRLFRSSRNLLAHVKIAPEALILSVFFRVLFNSSFRILVMLGLTLFMVGSTESGTAGLLMDFSLFLLLYPLLILSGMAIGILLAPFNAIYSDVDRITSLIIVPLRFATPVFFNITSAKVLLINPVAVFIVNLRDVATHQGFYYPGVLLFWIGVFTVIFCIGTFLFHLAVPVLSERA
ncbi:MAG: ABC transporter permease [Candidatus Hydrogenedentes bacterium]|nr:ABC transporter permease [Candidatus Hydrogenedentota bacterium]